MNRAAALVVLVLPLGLFASSPAHAEEASPPPPATAAPAAQAAPPVAPAAATAEGGVVVELAADDGRATIERRVSTSSHSGLPILETGALAIGNWEHACIAPCQVKLDPRYVYRVGGDGLVPTPSFVLRGDHMRVDAKMGSSTGRIGGIVATGAGVLAIAAGGLALAATPVLESEDVGSKGFRSAVLAGGASVLAAGVVAAGVGLYLWLSNGSSARTEAVARR
jgi:hypothetical protein